MTASELSAEGLDVTVLDKRSDRLDAVADLPHVRSIQGNAIDMDFLRQSGVPEADVVYCLAEQDNTNLMIGQISAKLLKAKKVYVRVGELTHKCVFEEGNMEVISATGGLLETLVTKANAPVPQTADFCKLHPPYPDRPSAEDSNLVIIVGGGKVGVSLARALNDSGHEVVLVEWKVEQAMWFSNTLGIPVIVGDGTTVPVLERAGAPRARAVVSVTESDQANLIASQVAQRFFKVPRPIARANDPKNEDVMHALGLASTISSTAIIQRFIEQELPTIKIKSLLSLQRGTVQILEYDLAAGCPAVGKALKSISLPKECNVAAVLRGDATIIPRGDTVFQAGDVVVALIDSAHEPDLRRMLVG